MTSVFLAETLLLQIHQHLSLMQVAQAGRDAVLGMAAILVPADVPRLLAALDELACFPDEDVRQSVVIMLAGLTGLLSQRSCADLLLPRVMKLLEDNAYLVRKVSQLSLPISAHFFVGQICLKIQAKLGQETSRSFMQTHFVLPIL